MNYGTALKIKPQQYSVAGKGGLASEMCNKESIFSLHRDQYSYLAGKYEERVLLLIMVI